MDGKDNSAEIEQWRASSVRDVVKEFIMTYTGATGIMCSYIACSFSIPVVISIARVS